jgi:HK97 family phage major capsid protein
MTEHVDPAALETISKEIKGFGDNVTALRDSLQKDLADVRKIAEEAKGAASHPEIKAQLDALTTSVAEKHTAIEKSVKSVQDHADEVEKKMNRLRLGAGQDVDAEVKAAREFHRTALSIRGELKAGTVITDDKIDFDGIKSWNDQFKTYLRAKDDRSVDAKAMSVGSDPDGGYLVPVAVSSRMLSIVYETSPMRELATVETIGTDAIEYPIDDDEADCGWVGETEARTETGTPQVGVQRIPVHEMYAMPKATQKLLEDASIDVEAWLGRKVGEKFGRTEATAFISGTGVKQPRGILSYASGTTRGMVERGAAGHATAITADSLLRLSTSLKEPYTAGASWLMRRATTTAVMLLKDGNGQYMWRPGLEAGKPSVLLGSPVREAADMPTVEAGALPIAFGNWRQGYTIVDRLGISTLRDPYTAKPFVLFYTRRRVGGDVTNFEAFKLMVVSAS